MNIGADYPTPVTVNGYSCKNCTEVDYAKKNIDPAHPKSGPFGINEKSDPSKVNNRSQEAVSLDGIFANISRQDNISAEYSANQGYGQNLNIKV